MLSDPCQTRAVGS